ncbi:hypothetical protein ACFSTI_20730 [Rhizorhabdus histidinilytica]|uniref:Secreted protein n=1 Tax=Rhizorhabdus histidinilytica TaxID=439228 RepID=A0A1T5BNM4_9SPHN|nr:hypothetical protein [Rhizorhabdus histidinilytica]SKB48854.1 hypothetical protein SAMN06295920_103158 [Rhizorhabdus histidinilytica]
MIRYVILAIASLATFAVSTAHAIVGAVDRFLEFVLSSIAWPPQPFALVGEGHADALPAGAPLDASLQQGLRHEAHVRRRSADRNI